MIFGGYHEQTMPIVVYKEVIHIYTTIYKIDNRQGPTVQHRELHSVL